MWELNNLLIMHRADNTEISVALKGNFKTFLLSVLQQGIYILWLK